MNDLKREIENSVGRELFAKFLTDNFGDNSLLDKFDKLTELYCDINSAVNISALRNIDDIYIKHYLDSVHPYNYFDGRCCDVGCGGGFPCIPLAITTGLDFTGIDGIGKKLALIRRCAAELPLNNISAEHSRSEELAKRGILFDTVCARAVADTDKALTFCAPLAKPNGKIILYKTQNDIPAKQSTCVKLKVDLVEAVDYTLFGTDIKRRLFIYKK